ncbi:hypothetical protein ACRE_057150 [Hapsidospora chrysogenum ATCC 11550]|uniref:Uncharacterized protein n=1 Tax=Hapsidospora chrysogenum (strain ATCC 11550 / CBS 779.69 / DSM 880 / IAM 14645 / JCM 23072 / IMI 49137) TaxID=857340 RepID=A0A086T2E4_HAPC1|nr:hypothetical protein ACRE_057150 [Hapsidospora chrysogenum ATCC 11550]
MSVSTINVVKFYFHERHIPDSEEYMRKVIALAYQTPRKDPKGLHVTLYYKDDRQLREGTHVACHGYVKDEETMEFREATDTGEKLDSTKKSNKNRTPVWPDWAELWAAPDIGYSHLE